MKTNPRLLALTVGFSAFVSLVSAATYTWNPNSEPAVPNTGGDAIWNSTDTFWRNDSGANVAESTFLSDAALTLNFYGVGAISKSGASTIANGTHTFNFAADSAYTITSTAALATILVDNGNLYFNAGANATLGFSASTGNTLKLSAGSNTSGGVNLAFGGGGIVNIGANTHLETKRNANTFITGGTTLNFNAGSLYAGGGASFADPAAFSSLSRIIIDNGSLNINGGTIITGPSGAATAARNVGIRVGNSSLSTLTVTSGNLTALGDARASATTPSTNTGGIIIGNSSNTNTGGTVNLLGGNITTSSIQTVSTVEKAVLNLNGSTIIVSTATGGVTSGAAPTDTQRNNFLNQFIAGFANTDDSHVAIGSNGVTFDTSQVDPILTGVTTIRSNVRGTGGLAKIGNPTLRLSGANSYTGLTDIREGKLILNGSLLGATTVRSNATLSGTGSAADVRFEDNSFLTPTSSAFSAASVTVNGTLTLQLDLALANGSAATFASLIKDGDAFINLELSNIDPLQTYTLFTITGANGFFDSDITVTNDLQSLGLTAKFVGSSFVLTQIPEPSALALISSAAALVFVFSRSRRRE